jgi:hypothetical protein
MNDRLFQKNQFWSYRVTGVFYAFKKELGLLDTFCSYLYTYRAH